MTPESAKPSAPPASEPAWWHPVRRFFFDWERRVLPEVNEHLSPNEQADIRTEMAETRTLMAADRTLMAWLRTALSLNSFGFTIYKVLAAYQESGSEALQEHSPRSIGLFLTAMGALSMVMGTVEYWHTLREVRKLREFRLARPPLIMALLMSFASVFLFFAIFTRLF